jgi:hypothetical protein
VALCLDETVGEVFGRVQVSVEHVFEGRHCAPAGVGVDVDVEN